MYQHFFFDSSIFLRFTRAVFKLLLAGLLKVWATLTCCCCHPVKWRRQQCQMLKARISHHSSIQYAYTKPPKTSIGKGPPIHLSIHLWWLFIHYERGWSSCTRSNHSFVNISLNYILIQLWWHLGGEVAPSTSPPQTKFFFIPKRTKKYASTS